MVCINDRDEEAAETAGVASIKLNHLLGGVPHASVWLPGERARSGNGKAPAAFIPGA